MHRLLVSSLWAHYNMQSPGSRCNAFWPRSELGLQHFLDGLLLDDEVLIPTQDYIALPVIVRRLGMRPFLELLESGCCRFVRFPGAIAYAGNGLGMQAIGVEEPNGKPRPILAPPSQSASMALDSVGEEYDPALVRAIEQMTIQMDVSSIFGGLTESTYSNVRNSSHLRTFFTLRTNDFLRLPGIKPNDLRIYGGPDTDWIGDEIDVLLALATSNLELQMMSIGVCTDIATTSPILELLKGKVEERTKANLPTSISDAFSALRYIADIPDVSSSVLSGKVGLSELIRLRNSRHGREFRRWFHEHKEDDHLTLARAYATLLKEITPLQSVPSRIMRFVTTTAIGLIPILGTIAGPLVGAVDSFVIDRHHPESSTIVFMDKLRQYLRRATADA